MLCDFLEEISIICILHHNAKISRNVTDQIRTVFELTIVKMMLHQ